MREGWADFYQRLGIVCHAERGVTFFCTARWFGMIRNSQVVSHRNRLCVNPHSSERTRVDRSEFQTCCPILNTPSRQSGYRSNGKSNEQPILVHLPHSIDSIQNVTALSIALESHHHYHYHET